MKNITSMTHKGHYVSYYLVAAPACQEHTDDEESIIMHHQLTATPFLQRVAKAAALLMTTMLLFSCRSTTSAFQNPPILHSRLQRRQSTTLYLEDHIAKMIDDEMRRLYQKHETQSQWEAQQRELQSEIHGLPENYDFESEFTTESTTQQYQNPASVQGFTSGVNRSISGPQRRKDEKMVEDDPMRYCADRCVSTGNCDVFEDMFEMGPEEVIKFCTECVLSEDETPCDVPANLFDDGKEEVESGGLHP